MADKQSVRQQFARFFPELVDCDIPLSEMRVRLGALSGEEHRRSESWNFYLRTVADYIITMSKHALNKFPQNIDK